MSRGWALWVLGWKGQRSRSQCIDNWKWFMLHNCFPFSPIIMKIHTKTSHESRMSPMGFGVKRSKVKVTMQCLLKMVYVAKFLSHHTKTPHEVRTCRMDFGVKRSKVKVTMHWLLNGLCCIIAFPFHLSSWNFIQRLPMSRGWALWVLGWKGQRSRSQCIDYSKWFLVHNCFRFTSAFIKLHAHIPSESRICPNDIGIKAWRVWIGHRGGYFVPLGQPHSSLNIRTLYLFYRTYRQGMHDLKVWPDVEADPSSQSKTPGRTKDHNDLMSKLAKVCKDSGNNKGP